MWSTVYTTKCWRHGCLAVLPSPPCLSQRVLVWEEQITSIESIPVGNGSSVKTTRRGRKQFPDRQPQISHIGDYMGAKFSILSLYFPKMEFFSPNFAFTDTNFLTKRKCFPQFSNSPKCVCVCGGGANVPLTLPQLHCLQAQNTVLSRLAGSLGGIKTACQSDSASFSRESRLVTAACC